jgi:aminoglycoside N3'-acetyltransferase
VKAVTQRQVVQALQALGLSTGDRLLVHSAVQFLGKPQDDEGRIQGVGLYLAAIQEVLGSDGTLAVPAFNFAFARGEPFDPNATPSDGMGAFSEYVRQQPGVRRSMHPLQSLAVLGPLGADLAGRDTSSAFDPGSAFERLLDLEFKLLLLGADVNAISLVHYSEQRAGVPYRYWKQFSGRVRQAQSWQECTYRMYVRDLDLNPTLDLHPVQRLLEQQGRWLSAGLNYGQVSCCLASDFVAATDKLLAEDPWVLVANRETAQDLFLQKSTLNFRG